MAAHDPAVAGHRQRFHRSERRIIGRLSRRLLAQGLDWTDANAGRVVGVLVVALLGVGMAYSLHLGKGFRFADERDYWHWASSIADDFSYHLGGRLAYRPPGYPALLALVIALHGPVWAARFVNFVVLAGSAVCLYDLGQRFARPAAGALAAGWIAAYPLLIYTAGTLYPQTLAGFLLLGALCLVSRGRRLWVTAGGGLVYGALILVVPTFAALLPVIALWIALKARPTAWGPAALFCIAAVAVVAPWIVRNHAVVHHWVFVSTNSGVNLALGNAPGTTPRRGVDVDLSYIHLAPKLGEVARSRAYTGAALHWMGAHPRAAATLYAGKLVHYFAVSPRLATRSQTQWVYAYILGATYAPLLAVMLWRLITFAGFRWRSIELLVMALYLGFGIVMAVFFTRIRFRVPLDTALLLVVGIAVTQLTERLAAGRKPPLEHKKA